MIFNLFIILILLAFIIRTLRQIFYQTFLWQQKEYRLDRLIAHLKTPLGKKLYFNPSFLIKWALFIFIFGSAAVNNFQGKNIIAFWTISYAYYLFWTIWIFEAILALKDLLIRNWRLPQFSPKASFVVLIALLIQFYPIITIFWFAPLLLAPLLDKILAPSIFLTILMLNIPTNIYKKIIIIIASRKIANLKNLTTIGITGSFGKTSTKEFLASILESKYKVIKTPGSINTALGIASFINQNITPQHQYFVCEVAAYKKGEIREISQMLKPQIAIITGISNQHLQLFGGFNNIIKSKFELIESLPKEGLAILNGDNRHCRQMAKQAQKLGLKTYLVSQKKLLKDIKTGKDYLQFTLILGNLVEKFKLNLLGEQNLPNLVLVIFLAHILGLSAKDLKNGLKKIKPLPKTMNFIKKSSKLSLIDDSFNVTDLGVQSAIDYMKHYHGCKILILNPIIELGQQEANAVHQDIGKIASQICDYILVTNINYIDQLKKGVAQVKGAKTKILLITKNLLVDLTKNLKPDSLIIFEGKESIKWVNYFQ